jgi:hypothetical protein
VSRCPSRREICNSTRSALKRGWVGSATCEGWGWQGRLLPVEVLSACAWLATSGPVLARFMVHQLRLPRPLVIYPWLWLAAKADDLDRKRPHLRHPPRPLVAHRRLDDHHPVAVRPERHHLIPLHGPDRRLLYPLNGPTRPRRSDCVPKSHQVQSPWFHGPPSGAAHKSALI